MLLRAIVALFGLCLIAGGIVMLLAAGAGGASVVPMFMGALIVIGTIFEARRYRAKSSAPASAWQQTGERFVDPTSGKLLEVRYNPETGEREYVDAS